MRSSILTVTMAGMASAVVLPRIAIMSESKGFRLLVRVHDYDTDLAAQVNNKYIGGIHIGAAREGVLPILDGSKGPVFWVNGTDAELQANQGHVFSDLDNGMYPLGWQIYKNPDTLLGSVEMAPGLQTAGVSVFDGGLDGPAYLQPTDYMACLRPAVYTGELTPFIFQRDTKDNAKLPEDCVIVKLLPECAYLQDLPAGATYNHDHAQTSRCYVDAFDGGY
ncbi:hypothetical protein VHEMI06770 [[Torrubiella] hemipterigena]|uniref:DUF7907 domain-containing protein n=1 Tax=[Torrubiella] hemipterigena TaxID=1531966 RepID=A0A0A1TK81_9HYPO|nr:hypothetical protein VHEMI06770 [[Torrubiella] hemipterigena]